MDQELKDKINSYLKRRLMALAIKTAESQDISYTDAVKMVQSAVKDLKL